MDLHFCCNTPPPLNFLDQNIKPRYIYHKKDLQRFFRGGGAPDLIGDAPQLIGSQLEFFSKMFLEAGGMVPPQHLIGSPT